MRLNSVVFPAPLGPINARRSPGCTSRPTPSTARRPPKCLVTPSNLSASMICYPSPPEGVRARNPPHPCPLSRGEREWALAVLAWRIVACVEGLLQELVGIVFPELAHRGIGEDHRVLDLTAYPLHLAHVDVLDGIAPLVDDHGPAREVLELHLLEGSEEGLAVFYLAIDRLDGLHDPAHVRVAGLRVIRRNLARLGLEGLGVLLVGGIVEGGRVVKSGVDAEGLVAHLREHRLVGERPVADERDLRLEPRLRVLLHELQRTPPEEDSEDGIGVGLDLGDEGREVGGVERRPDLLDHLTALLLEGALEAPDRFPAEGVVEAHRGHLLVLE